MFFDYAELIEKFTENGFTDWDGISSEEGLDEDFIRKHSDNLNWDYICEYQILSPELMNDFHDRLNFKIISSCQELPEDFIDKFHEKFFWTDICRYQVLNEDFMRRHDSKLDFAMVSRWQKFSMDFYIDYIDRMNRELVFKNRFIDFSEESVSRALSSREVSVAPASLPSKISSDRKSRLKADNIEDFGAKIGGARKDIVGRVIEAMQNIRNPQDIKNLAYSKSWAEPRYTAMIKDGVSPEAVSMIRGLRDGFYKPNSALEANSAWAAGVLAAKDMSAMILSDNVSVDSVADSLSRSDSPYERTAYAYYRLYSKFGNDFSFRKYKVAYGRFYIGFSYNSKFGYKATIDRDKIFSEDINDFIDRVAKVWVPPEKKSSAAKADGPKWMKDFSIDCRDDGRWYISGADSGMGYSLRQAVLYGGSYDSEDMAKEALINAVFKDRIYIANSRKDNGETVFSIWKRYGKNLDNRFMIRGGFVSEEAASSFAKDNLDMILDGSTSFSEAALTSKHALKWSEMRSSNAPDRRNGQNVTPEMFSAAFGFRGVQFGNWNNQEERQVLLNSAYDAFFDLADVLDVPPTILSLNGELGIAFGARGKGRALAHFEPSYTVINLTKEKGAGSLAHEWLHALDNYLMIKGGILSNKRNSEGYLVEMSAAIKYMASNKEGNAIKNANLSDSIKNSLKELVYAMRNRQREVVGDLEAAERQYRYAEEYADREANNVRNFLAKERKYYKKTAPASAEQLERFDRLIKAAYNEPIDWNMVPSSNCRSVIGKINWVNKPLIEINDLHKEISGVILYRGSKPNPLGMAIRRMQAAREKYEKLKACNTEVREGHSYFYDEAKRLENSTPYWTTEWEMMARAFSAYVEDKLTEKGYESNFLNRDSNNEALWRNNSFAAMLKIKPFPEGDERRAIREKFDSFFTSIRNEIEDTKKLTGEIKFSIQAGVDRVMERTGKIGVHTISKAFAGCAVRKTADDEFVVYLPNSERIYVSSREQIVMTEEQKLKAIEAHGISRDENVIANGYYIDGDGYGNIVVSEQGEKGTIYHEAFHLANKFLTDEQRAILCEAFGNDEAQAEAYKNFADEDSSAVSKIFREAKRVINGVTALFGYREPVRKEVLLMAQEIFKKIRQGDVWLQSRNASDSDDKKKILYHHLLKERGAYV